MARPHDRRNSGDRALQGESRMISFVKPTLCSARLCAAAAVGLLEVSLIAGHPFPARAGNVTLTETGSTLIDPLFKVWAADYTKTHSGVAISPSATNSVAGVEQAISGAVQIGASDAYMSDGEVEQNPLIINVPMAISAQTVNYNIHGLNQQNLKLSGPVLAGIYTGKIRAWDDPAIAALNPGANLPHNNIAPIHRSDPSGDTFVFTQYLAFSTEKWDSRIGFMSPESWQKRMGFGTTVAWPATPGASDAVGNAGMVEKIAATPYSVGYVGVSFHDAIAKAALGTAALQSYDGEFLLPTPQAIEAAAAALWPRTPPDERLTLVNAPGANAYPLINYEYAVVSKKQPSPETAAARRSFLLWAIAPDETNAQYLANAHFIPLPAHVWVLSHDQIEEIK
jgi:phosphate transport system substrate-binding protein